MRLYTVSSTGLAIVLYISRVCASWHIYKETTFNQIEEPLTEENHFKFYNGPPKCDDRETASFLDVVDVTELPHTNSARCDGCPASLDEGKLIEQFEWYDKSGKPSTWERYTYYRNQGGIFVDVKGNRKGTCVQETSGRLECQDASDIHRVGNSLLVCERDAPKLPREPQSKFMVAGDSISCGMEYDWTWRWRLSAWLEAQGHKTSFVGPFIGPSGPALVTAVLPHPPPSLGESNPKPERVVGLYAKGVAESFFSSGHASIWGRQASQTLHTIQGWVRTYQPDYLLLMLGFNDFGWGTDGPDVLLQRMQQLIIEARKGKPNVQILVGNIVHRSYIREDLFTSTIKYNNDLPNVISSWSAPDSLVSLVDVQGNYNCSRDACPDGYDGLHPNSRGEYHIAQAYAKVLKANYGFTGADFEVPANPEPRTLSIPTGVIALSTPAGIHVTWNKTVNTRGYEIRSRLKGETAWTGGPVVTITNAAYSTALTEGQTWEYQVRASGDDDDKSGWSEVVSAVAHRRTAPAPNNIIAKPRPNGTEITWSMVTGYSINRYALSFQDLDTVNSPQVVYGARGTSLILDGLIPDHRYLVTVSTWINDPAGSAEGPSNSTIATAGRLIRPPPPKKVEVFEQNSVDVQLSWPAATGAQGYYVYRRPILQEDTASEFVRVATLPATLTSATFDNLSPGTGHFEFCVASFTEDLESDYSQACTKTRLPPGLLPAAPSKLKISKYDAKTVQLSWPRSKDAQGYYVYRRPISVPETAEVFSRVATTVASSTNLKFKIKDLFPGVWNWEFCVAAFAGDLESDPTTACAKYR